MFISNPTVGNLWNFRSPVFTTSSGRSRTILGSHGMWAVLNQKRHQCKFVLLHFDRCKHVSQQEVADQKKKLAGHNFQKWCRVTASWKTSKLYSEHCFGAWPWFNFLYTLQYLLFLSLASIIIAHSYSCSQWLCQFLHPSLVARLLNKNRDMQLSRLQGDKKSSKITFHPAFWCPRYSKCSSFGISCSLSLSLSLSLFLSLTKLPSERKIT